VVEATVFGSDLFQLPFNGPDAMAERFDVNIRPTPIGANTIPIPDARERRITISHLQYQCMAFFNVVNV
jgi:hypothetical protein